MSDIRSFLKRKKNLASGIGRFNCHSLKYFSKFKYFNLLQQEGPREGHSKQQSLTKYYALFVKCKYMKKENK